MRKLFAAVALLAMLFAGKAMADDDAWFRPMTSVEFSALTTTELTSDRFARTGWQYYQIVLSGATGFVTFYDLTTQTFGRAATSINRVYLPNNEMVRVIAGRGQHIGIRASTAGSNVIIITVGEASK